MQVASGQHERSDMRGWTKIPDIAPSSGLRALRQYPEGLVSRRWSSHGL